MRAKTWALVGVLGVVVTAGPAVNARQPAAQATAPPACARTWAGHEAALEPYLKEAKVERLEGIDLGVTRPQRAHLAPGGLVESFAWKPLTPGIYDGFWESYKSEVAAYELDKLIGLGMVPVAVERRVQDMAGAAIMWVAPVRMWRTMPRAERPTGRDWDLQRLRANMFDNLICNTDRNQGNLLIDGDDHLILIDHSRAFTTRKELPVKFVQVDADLWARMQALTTDSLTAALGPYLMRDQIRAVLERRDRMQQAVDALIAKRGRTKVLIR